MGFDICADALSTQAVSSADRTIFMAPPSGNVVIMRRARGARREELLDLRVGDAGFLEHFAGVLAQPRRVAAVLRNGLRPLGGHAEHADAPFARVLDGL